MKAMRLYQDISKGQYMVTRETQPKLRDRKTKVQKVDGESGLPMWSTELTVLMPAPDGASVIEVTTLGEAPSVSIGEYVQPVGLEALPWNSQGQDGQWRSGVAFRASELRSLTAVSAKAA